MGMIYYYPALSSLTSYHIFIFLLGTKLLNATSKQMYSIFSISLLFSLAMPYITIYTIRPTTKLK